MLGRRKYFSLKSPGGFNHIFTGFYFTYSFFFFFLISQTRLVRPGTILASRIHAGMVGCAVKVPAGLFAIAQMGLQDSAATSIAPSLRVRRAQTAAQGHT